MFPNVTINHPSPHFGLVLDCADPDRLAEFWAAALGYVNVGAAGVYVALYPREGNGPKLLLHAESLELTLPDKSRKTFSAPLPDKIKGFDG